MNAILLHQRRVTGGDTIEKAGQVVNPGFAGNLIENLLEARIVGRTQIGRHANADQQYRDRLLFGEAHHLPQVVGTLPEAESAQPIVAAEFDDQVAGLVLAQQAGQALQSTEGGFTANTGIDDACLRKTCPYIGAEQLRPAPVYGNIVGGAQTVTQDQNLDLRMRGVSDTVNAKQNEKEYG